MCCPKWVRQAGLPQPQSCLLPLTQEVGIFLSSSLCELVDLNVSITLVAGETVSLSPVREPDNMAMFLFQIAKHCGAQRGVSVRDPV